MTILCATEYHSINCNQFSMPRRISCCIDLIGTMRYTIFFVRDDDSERNLNHDLNDCQKAIFLCSLNNFERIPEAKKNNDAGNAFTILIIIYIVESPKAQSQKKKNVACMGWVSSV